MISDFLTYCFLSYFGRVGARSLPVPHPRAGARPAPTMDAVPISHLDPDTSFVGAFDDSGHELYTSEPIVDAGISPQGLLTRLHPANVFDHHLVNIGECLIKTFRMACWQTCRRCCLFAHVGLSCPQNLSWRVR